MRRAKTPFKQLGPVEQLEHRLKLKLQRAEREADQQYEIFERHKAHVIRLKQQLGAVRASLPKAVSA